MAIDSVKLDLKTFNEMGIGLSELPLENSPLNLHSLGNIVLIAGANGAGKTRLLRLIKLLSSRVLSEGSLDSLRARLANEYAVLKIHQKELNAVESENINVDNEVNLKNKTTTLNGMIASSHREISESEKKINSSEVMKLTSPGPFGVIDFVPKMPYLIDAAKLTDQQASQRAWELKKGGGMKAEENAPAYARSILRAALRGRDRTHKENKSETSDEEKNAIDLLAIIHDLLGRGFNFDLNNELNLTMGRENSESYSDELSQGQQVLFQLACMLHAQKDQLSGSVVLMDEPENHLHPAVLNEVLDKLRSASGIGQIWIATHSVPLIAHVIATDPDCLWYAEDGSFTRAGRAPIRVLEGLMGGSKGTADLQMLTRLPAEYAAMRFLSECLVAPGVVGPDTKDPQTNQIADIISRLAKGRAGALRIIDFGAGVGRLLTTLVAYSEDGDVKSFVDYRAFEPDPTKHLDLEKEIGSVYPDDTTNRIFHDDLEIQAKLKKNSVDVIVMCNVLHEVCPDNWLSLFDSDGPMMSLLADDGYLLIVEDYGIPIGERAHRYGFLLLDQLELAALFDINENDQDDMLIRVESKMEKYKNRLAAHLVAKKCVIRVSSKTRENSINILNKRMRKLVSQNLEFPPEISNNNRSNDYPRNAQLYVNSSLWLADHGLASRSLT